MNNECNLNGSHAKRVCIVQCVQTIKKPKRNEENRKCFSTCIARIFFGFLLCVSSVRVCYLFCFVLFCDLIAFWDAHTKAKFLAFMARTHARSRARSRSRSGSHAGMRCSDAQDARLRQTLHAQVKQQRCVSCCSCSCCPFVVVVVVVVACCKCCMCGAGGGVAG